MTISKVTRLIETIEDLESSLHDRFQQLPITVNPTSRDLIARLFADYASAYKQGDDRQATDILSDIADRLTAAEQSSVLNVDESAVDKICSYKVTLTYGDTSNPKQRNVVIENVANSEQAMKIAEVRNANLLNVTATRAVVTEGPFDFLRGAASEVGRKVSNSRLAQGARDVVAAGRTSSAVGDLKAIFQQLEQLMDKLPNIQSAQPSPQATPTQPTTTQQQVPAQPRGPLANPNFSAAHKPKMTPGKHGYEYQFSSHMQQVFGQELNEDARGFMAGAAGHVGNAVADKIRSYGNKPSFLRDIYNAGKMGSQLGDMRKQAAERAQLRTDIKRLIKTAIEKLVAQGPQAAQILAAAAPAGGKHAERIVSIIQQNGPKFGLQMNQQQSA